jgi:hypothetical protein
MKSLPDEDIDKWSSWGMFMLFGPFHDGSKSRDIREIP